MLTDPKYQVSYFQDINKLGDFVRDKYSKIKLLMVSLSTDQQQWAFLDRCQKEGLAQWPVLLFTEVALNPQVKKQLFQLGVRAVVKKGCSQEELQYVVQSFIMQASANLLRKNARALITLPAVYKFDGKEVSSNTFTLSRDGVFIRDLAPPPTGSMIDLKVFIPGRSSALATSGEVIYSVPYFVGVNRIHVSGMAVKFLDLTETDQKEIDQFVSRALTGYLMEEESES
ncbi:MAG: PilZ domain-containing protein [Bdellovibrionota bacterium]